MNIWNYFFQRNRRNHLYPVPSRDNRVIRSPIDHRTIRPGFRQRDQYLFFLIHRGTQSFILTVQLGDISIARIRVQQFGRNQRVLRGVQHMNDRIVIMRSDQTGKTDQVGLFFNCLFYNHVCRNHHSQIDHLIIIASQDDRNNILSNVMHVTFHCRKQNLSCLSRIRRDLFCLDRRLQDGDCLFHRTGSLDNLR